jgi:hypothetical protein
VSKIEKHIEVGFDFEARANGQNEKFFLVFFLYLSQKNINVIKKLKKIVFMSFRMTKV